MTTAPDLSPAAFDVAHDADAHPLARRLFREGMADDYPEGADPYSPTTRAVLARVVERLALPAGSLLLDAGCGSGGPGLWLARALDVDLLGIDFSAAAVRRARERSASYVVDPRRRREHLQAPFEALPLADASVDGAVGLFSLPFAEDRSAVFRELRRVVRPRGRLVFTAATAPPDPRFPRPPVQDWAAALSGWGWELVAQDEHPECQAAMLRIFEAWRSAEHELRAQVGDRATDDMLQEAAAAPPLIALSRHWVLTARRPAP